MERVGYDFFSFDIQVSNVAYFLAWFSVVYSFAKLELFEMECPMLPYLL